ncbi:MAG: ABC transporter ATP-binding protein [Actinobacteria bacterium]|nr:ABC transporter ATP-binding protein [Actinomycetota bacterium]
MASVEFIGASHTYPKQEKPAVSNLSMAVRDGELITIVGPSGCGKSTTLRMLAGLEALDTGDVLIGGIDVTQMPTRERDVAMVFQNYALYPHMSVAENLGFALRVAGLKRDEIERRIATAAEMLDLTEVLNRRPRALSGGQRQRVAMGRAVVRQPKAFLLDEPLSNLDTPLRVQTRIELMAMQRTLGATMLYVTHDQAEAMTMGSRVAVMNNGTLEQFGTPQEIYDQPESMFIARFVGTPAMNLIHARASGGLAQIANLRLPTPTHAPADVVIGIRPEDVEINDVSPLRATIERFEVPGAETYLYCVAAGIEEPLVVRTAARSGYGPGDQIGIQLPETALHVFDAATTRRV